MVTVDIDERRELLLALDDASQHMNRLVLLKPEWLARPEVQELLAEMRSGQFVVNPFGRPDMVQFTSKGRAHYGPLIAAM